MEIQEYLNSKRINEKQKTLCEELKSIHSSINPFKSNKVSKENAHLGLLFLNGFAEQPKQTNSYYYYGSIHTRQIEQGDERFVELEKVSAPTSFWDGKRFELLEYFFGKELAPLVKSAWLELPNLMYQTGYARRSFRAPNLTKVTFLRQVNFIIQLLDRLSHDLSLEEYIIYSNKIYSPQLSHLLASAIDGGDEKVKNLLLDIVYNRHETAKVSGEIVKAMLLSHDESAWEAVGKLLLSAQRQEGLRQIIVEQLDETSLGAMQYLLNLIVEHKLSRFSSVVRALDVWAGLGWEGQRENTISKFLDLAQIFLNNPEKIEPAIASKDNAEVYMALWSQGVLDAEKCLPLLQKLAKNNTQEKILLALYFARETALSTICLPLGLEYVKHETPIVYSQAIHLLDIPQFLQYVSKEEKSALFELMEQKLAELPKVAKVVEGKVFSWLNHSYSQTDAYHFMINLLDLKQESELKRIMPHFQNMPINQRETISREVLTDYYSYSYRNNKQKTDLPKLSQFQRDFAFATLKDRSETVRSSALNALEFAEIKDGEMIVFEDMLKSKSADTRKSVINIILQKKPRQVQDSAERLLLSKSQDQRLAGLDLLVNLKRGNKEFVSEQAHKFAERGKITKKEEIILETLLPNENNTLEYSWENGFGLYDPAKTSPTPTETPKITNPEYEQKIKQNPFGLSKSVAEINKALADLAKAYEIAHDYEYTYETWDGGNQTTLLGNEFIEIKRWTKKDGEKTAMEQFQNLPLHNVWQKWFEDSGLTNSDLFLVMLSNGNIMSDASESDWKKTIHEIQKFTFKPEMPKIGRYDWQNPLIKILQKLSDAFPYEKKGEFLEGLIARVFQAVPKDELYKFKRKEQYGRTQITTWRDLVTINNIYHQYGFAVDKKDDATFRRFWELEFFYRKAFSEEIGQQEMETSPLYNYARAFSLGLIGRDELFWRIMSPEQIRELTHPVRKNQYNIREEFPILRELIAEAIPRLLSIELKRGDSETAVSKLVSQIGRIEGVSYLIQILQALGKDKLHRGYSYYSNNSKKEQLSKLLKNCFPLETETQKDFDEAVNSTKISEERLVEVAMYAPQWIDFVSTHLGWNEMKSAIWWLHAHTNGRHDSQTEAEFAKYSSVEASDFQQGAVDAEWFMENYKALGKAKWETLYKSAKYISDGNGHTRALLYSDVILKIKKITEITKRVKDKRNQDYLRVYGLVPLSKANHDKDLLKRYQFIQQFKKESKQFGSQRQTSEGIAVRIALENLARTAGFPDPIRLQWAMETEEAKQILKDNPKLTFNNVEIWLEIDDFGQSSIQTKKDDKKLQSIPAKLRKDKAVVAMKEANKTLREQYRRTRKSLEMAMINGDEFLRSEVETLITHPVVSPLLHKLVLISDGKFGFLANGKLLALDRTENELGETVRISHCTDLHKNLQWSEYQKYCFDHKLKQPFKQIFRELYTPTADELHEKTISRRYAGHQVQPNKTVALLKGQGWTVNYEEGLQKVFHKQGIMVQMFAMADWFSPADVEAPTLETVQFFDKKTYKPIPFEQLDARVFSEAMRDLDLVVSVAHVGETDPEASQSTLELRSVIVEETARLFKLKNVTLTERHAKIKGELGEYSVHLGSGVTHKMPGIYLSILPVHSQHRGRMFLPFLDEDPKTAEIMSKILLLAKDKEIQDPTILRQM